VHVQPWVCVAKDNDDIIRYDTTSLMTTQKHHSTSRPTTTTADTDADDKDAESKADDDDDADNIPQNSKSYVINRKKVVNLSLLFLDSRYVFPSE